MSDALTALRARLAEIADLRSAAVLLGWDQLVKMPPGGAEARAEQRATIERLAHERLVDDGLAELLDAAEPETDADRALLRVTRRDVDKARRVPGELVSDLARAGSAGYEAWLAAREADDAAPYLPFLERNLELRRRYAELFEREHPYDPLLDDFERGMRTAEARDVLGRLREGLVPLVEAAPHVDRTVIEGPFPIAAQRTLVDRVLRQVGVDDRAWRLDDAVHPFQASVAIDDIRLTTRFKEEGLEGLFAGLHEFGHGLYEHGVDPAYGRSPLAGGVSMAVHESQSRLWENMVGRGDAFWRWCFPLLREAFPGRFAEGDRPAVVAAFNAVRRSPVRVSADEVTYGLHIILRFELELELVKGSLAVADLRDAWAAKSRDYLGIDVTSDRMGVLQDVHWSEALIGYFPTYALGNVVAGQLWARATAELPGLEEGFAAGDFAPLRDWLRERVHRHGRSMTPAETIAHATGGPIDPEPYLAYLRAKVDASAALMS